MGPRIVLAMLFSAVLLGSCSSPSDVRRDGCHPCTVSKDVGPLLKEAQDMTKAGDWNGALGKVNQADAVKSTSDDAYVISQMRHYIEYRAVAQPGNVSSASDAKAKFANDYNAGRYRDVIADGELLRKFNVLDEQAQLVIGQAYFKAGDYVGCVNYAKPLNSDVAHQLEARCAYEVAKAPRSN